MYLSKKLESYPKILIIVFVFFCALIGLGIVLSLLINVLNPSIFYNVNRLHGDINLSHILVNTWLIYIYSISTQIIIVILVTIYFHSRKISGFIKLLLVTPYAMGVIAPAFSMNVLFSSSLGPFNVDIYSSPFLIRYYLAFIDTWQWLGVLLLFCFLAIEKIPRNHYEQARLEQISRVKRWWLITRPNIQGVIFIYTFIRFVDWIRKVDLVKAVYGEGGPGNLAETIGVYIVHMYYHEGGKGYAGMLSILQVIILGCLLTLLIHFINKRKYTF